MEPEWSRAIFEVAKIGGPLLTAAIYVLRAGYQKKWVWGWQLDEVVRDRDELQEKFDGKVAELEKELREALRLQVESHQRFIQMQQNHDQARDQKRGDR